MFNRLFLFPIILTVAAGMVVLASCSGKGTTPTASSAPLFFDLKGYFSREVQALSSVAKVKKTTVVNDQREELVLDDIDFERELEPFSEADINRPAWTDKYTIDSLSRPAGELVKITYTAADAKLKTKRIEIVFEGDKVAKVFIENSTESTVAKTKQLLTFEPGKGYSIESTQNVIFTSNDTFYVEVRFL